MKDTGGSAYPIVCDGDPVIILRSEGMTLRDYFATHSNIDITELLAFYEVLGKSQPPNLKGLCEDLAQVNYIYADAMIKERNKGE